MAELKTKKTKASVKEFLDGIGDEGRRRDCQAVARMMKKATGAQPRMWGASVVGFGDYHYKYASGRENDWFPVGFAPRKADVTLYFMSGLAQYAPLLKRLGKHTLGKGCLHVKRLADVDTGVLQELITTSVADLNGGKTPGR